MTDRFIYSCSECGNAIVGGYRPVRLVECPACGTYRDRYNDNNVNKLFKQEGRIK